MSIEIKKLCKTFLSNHGQVVNAIDSLDLVTQKSEFNVVIGATGCGKTTLLNIICGLDYADSGEVKLPEYIDANRDISYVFQHYTLFPWRNVLKNTLFGMEMRGIAKDQRMDKAEELLKDVGLIEYKNHFPHELSGGMRQRAAIAQALAIEPKLMIMDEPFSALDEATRRDIQEMFVRIWKDRKFSVIFVTHSIEEAVLLADKIIIMSKPGHVSEIIDIPFDRPRDVLSSQFDEKFNEIRHQASI